MSGVTDRNIIANMLTNRFSDSKYADSRKELQQSISNDGTLDSKEITSLKATFTKEFKDKNKGATDAQIEEAFYKSLSSVVGVDVNKLRSSATEPLKVSFNFDNIDTESGTVTVKTKADDAKPEDEGSESVVALSENNEVEVRTNNGRYDYKSSEAQGFLGGIKGLDKTNKVGNNVIRGNTEFYDGGSVDKIIQGAGLPDNDTKGTPRLSKEASKDIQKLQAFIGVPKNKQDGLFGAETMNYLKKAYADAISRGDKDTVNKLSNLISSLDARINDGAQNDPSLSKLSKAGGSFIKNSGNAENKQYSINTAKDKLEQTKKLLSENPPNLTAVAELKKGINSDSKLSDSSKKAIIDKIESMEDKAKETIEKPSIDALSSHIKNPPKELRGVDYVSKIDDNSGSKRGMAVEKAFRALYTSSGEGDKTVWTFKPDKTKIDALLKDENIVKNLTEDERKSLAGLRDKSAQEEEKPSIDKLSSYIKNPPKELRGVDYVSKIDDNSGSKRGMAVEKAFRALYTSSGEGENTIWKFEPSKEKLEAVLNDKAIRELFSRAELHDLEKILKSLNRKD
ncbi:MAG: hypothetical protein U0457_14425 [Candidatus Sericytochromatia bacterium]